MNEEKKKLTPMELRKRSKKTQRQIAEALGKKVTTISDWERGASYPRLTLPEVKRLMELYSCTLDELIEAFEKVDPVQAS